MKLLFVGNFQEGTATGEPPDEGHIARCLEDAGVEVVVCPRDEVRAFFDRTKQENIPEPQPFDVILIGKVRYFTESILTSLRERYRGVVVYWVWDLMRYYHFKEFPEGWSADFHLMLLRNCDPYLSGELGWMSWFRDQGINFQYFNWDTADGAYDQLAVRTQEHDVVFPGTFVSFSHRVGLLRRVQESYRLRIFGWDHETWRQEGFDRGAWDVWRGLPTHLSSFQDNSMYQCLGTTAGDDRVLEQPDRQGRHHGRVSAGSVCPDDGTVLWGQRRVFPR